MVPDAKPMRAGQTGPLISIWYSARTSWPPGAVAEPAGAEAPDAAGAPVGRFGVPGAAAARHAAVEARASQWRARALAAQLLAAQVSVVQLSVVQALAAQALPRRTPALAVAEPHAALSAAVEASVRFQPASPPMVRVWMVPTATHRRLACCSFRA
jgi:hypothetical protein